jgi:hypothetical protein
VIQTGIVWGILGGRNEFSNRSMNCLKVCVQALVKAGLVPPTLYHDETT